MEMYVPTMAVFGLFYSILSPPLEEAEKDPYYIVQSCLNRRPP